MNCEFYEDGEFIDQCEQTNIPRVGDGIIINYKQYAILSVVWNYDTRDICITVRGEP